MEKILRRDFLRGAALLGAAPALLSPAGAEKWPWLRTSRLVLAEGYVPPFYPHLECTGKGLAELAAAMGADVLRFPAVSRYALYPTQYYPQHPELGGRDLLRDTIEACHLRKIKVIPYIAVNVSVWPENVGGEIANWIGVNSKGEPTTSTLFSLDNPERFLQACLLSPIQDRIKAYIREITRNYDVDAVYFDGPYPYMSNQKCYCRFCQAAYQRDRGKAVPLQTDSLSREEEREYYEWFANDVVRKLMTEIRQIVTAEKDLPLIFNLTPFLFTRAYATAQANICDAFMFESRPGPITNKMYHLVLGQTTGKYLWSYLSTPHLASTDHLVRKRLGSWYSEGVDGPEVAMQGFAVIASGAAPIYWGLNNRYRATGDLEHLKAPFDFLKRNGAALQHLQANRYAGILTSSSSIDWYRYRPGGETGYSNAFYYGAYTLLKDAHVQAEPFMESRLTPEWLAQYRLVYLPNAACLSEAQVECIRQYVRNGGALLASYETSLYDERGNRRPDFALADVFGAHWKQSPDWYTDLFLHSTSEPDLPQDPDVTLVEAVNPGEVAAQTVEAARKRTLGPGLIVRPFGKGKVAYLAGSLEAVYYEARLRRLPGFMRRLVESLADEAAPYRLSAPVGVFGHLAQDRNSRVLHVLCDVGNKWKLPVSREEYAPVSRVTADIQLPQGARPKSVRLLRRGTPAPFHFENRRVTVELRDVEVYEAIHVEYL
ncbi:MAG TPA: alpha-amylase family protein [Bryobacteraceae bacterium]|nr:alpha-amylase family protein [Bryobacteraceae bacterium]